MPGGKCIRSVLFCVLAALAQLAWAYPNVYAPASNGILTVVDTATNKVIASPYVNTSPFGLAISPDGQWMYLTASAFNTLSVYSTLDNSLVGYIQVGVNPTAVAMSPDGYRAYVANTGDNTVSVINTLTNTVAAVIQVGASPGGLAVSPDGRRVYVVQNTTNKVSVIDTRSNTMAASVLVGTTPNAIVISPDNTRVYVANLNGTDGVYVIDAATNAVVAAIPLGPNVSPWSLVLSPDGSALYTSNISTASTTGVSVISTTTLAVVDQINVPGTSHLGIGITPDGTALYVMGGDTSALYEVSTASQLVTATINAANLANGLQVVGQIVGGSAPPQQNYTLTTSPVANGIVTSSPQGIFCSTNYSACTASFAPGTSVTLTALADDGNAFNGWTGDCSGSGACTLTMNAAHSATASFGSGNAAEYTLEFYYFNYPIITLAGGSATSSPPGIDCPSVSCIAKFPAGTVVTLSATAAAGYASYQWGGPGFDCGSVGGTCVVTMTATTQISLTFNPDTNDNFLTVGSTPTGVVTSSPAGISCSSVQCSAGFSPVSTVVLTATPNPGYYFAGWTGDCTGNGVCVVNMSQAHSANALFYAIVPEAGYWWNPAEPGSGFNIEEQGDTLFMAVFLYDVSGRATWWGAGPAPVIAGTFSSTLFADTGGPTLTGPYTPTTGSLQSGPITVNFTSNTTGTATFGGRTVPIQRYNFGPGGATALQAPGIPETGWWWAPTEGGRGYAVEVQSGTMFFAGYMYDSSGNPIWYASGPATMVNSSTYESTWQQFANGETLTGPWQASQVTNADAGSVAIIFSSSTSGTLTFPNGRFVNIQRYKF